MTVTGKNSQLTEHGDWVTSNITATVNEVVKDERQVALEPGTVIQFEQEGGEITVDQTRVTAVVRRTRPMRIGVQYLVFFWTTETNRLAASPHEIYEVIGSGALRGLAEQERNPDQEDDVQDYSVEYVIARIRQMLAARP